MFFRVAMTDQSIIRIACVPSSTRLRGVEFMIESMSDGLTKDEFYDVYRQFRPDADRTEYEAEWAEFQRLKAEHLNQMEIQ